MPEGPEIRREAMAVARVLVGEPIVRVEYRVSRLERAARALAGASVERVTSHGKAMLVGWDCGLTHYSHNQLYGSWQVVDTHRLRTLLDARGASVRVLIATRSRAAVLLSATDIDLLDASGLARHPYLAKLGPDVLDRRLTAAMVAARLRAPANARRSLASLLLDQSFLAGPGNYLRSEILHVARLRHTCRPADLADTALVALARAALALPRQSLATGGITNDRARARALRTQGMDFESARFRVYARERLPCYGCGLRIRRVDVAGRGVYFCPRCQPA